MSLIDLDVTNESGPISSRGPGSPYAFCLWPGVIRVEVLVYFVLNVSFAVRVLRTYKYVAGSGEAEDQEFLEEQHCEVMVLVRITGAEFRTYSSMRDKLQVNVVRYQSTDSQLLVLAKWSTTSSHSTPDRKEIHNPNQMMMINFSTWSKILR